MASFIVHECALESCKCIQCAFSLLETSQRSRVLGLEERPAATMLSTQTFSPVCSFLTLHPDFINTSSRVNDINAFEIKSLILNLESVLLRFEAVIAMWPICICALLVHGELLLLLAMCQKSQTNTYKTQLLVYLTRLKLFLIPLQCCASHSSLLFW